MGVLSVATMDYTTDAGFLESKLDPNAEIDPTSKAQESAHRLVELMVKKVALETRFSSSLASLLFLPPTEEQPKMVGKLKEEQIIK